MVVGPNKFRKSLGTHDTEEEARQVGVRFLETGEIPPKRKRGPTPGSRRYKQRIRKIRAYDEKDKDKELDKHFLAQRGGPPGGAEKWKQVYRERVKPKYG